VVTIGVFDGVHRGHAQIIGAAVKLAAAAGMPSALVTFDPPPTEVVRPGSHPPQLTTLVRRAELVEQLGIDAFCALPFTLEFSRSTPAEFAHQALVARLHAAHVVVGRNFRFGHGATGDLAMLTEFGRTFGFDTTATELLADGPTPLSATYVRSCVEAGDVAAAAEALGRPHRVDGLVERGDQRGRELGFPTANLRTAPYAAIPADGVYAGRVIRLSEQGSTLDVIGDAAISVGTNPTFEGRQRRVEAFVLDFDGDLYGHEIGVEFIHRLRPMARFDGVAELVAQMQRDVDLARELLADS
jgi:riboflavin kinase/FMN adenylyltransferase